MPITKKPLRSTIAQPSAQPVNVDEIIGRGNSVPAQATAPQPAKKRKALLLQLHPRILGQIAEELAKSPVRISRQTWIEIAIIEKLDRDRR